MVADLYVDQFLPAGWDAFCAEWDSTISKATTDNANPAIPAWCELLD